MMNINTTDANNIKIYDEIKQLCKEKDAVILAHYYVSSEIQAIADFVGDSFYLAKIANEIPNKVIVFCGVTFMGESAYILNPDKLILIPDMQAECPMALMTDSEEIAQMKNTFEDLAVVCYINSSASTKSLCDVCVTSSNALKIISELPQKNIYMIPDGNLASWIASHLPEKNIFYGRGYCHVHNCITLEDVIDIKNEHPGVKVLTHPECRSEVCEISDYVGSTSGIINFATDCEDKEFIVCTESGVSYELEKINPEKKFYFIEKESCKGMREITVEQIRDCLTLNRPFAYVDEECRKLAAASLERMMQLAEI